MDHSVFVSKYHAGQIDVSVKKNKAGFMYKKVDLMPQRLRIQQAYIRALGFGGILSGAVLFFFVPWWAALATLAFGLFMLLRARKLAAKGVLEASLESPLVYQTALHNNVLKIREKT